MKFAVILAHPKTGSLNAQIARTAVERLVALGHDVIMRDLYGMAFYPRRSADELPFAPDSAPAPDAENERHRLADRDGFVFVYPLWFNSAPAILKGFIERVFGLGFGYKALLGGGTRPALSGKLLLSFSTSGAPDHWMDSSGALKILLDGFDNYLGQVTGLKVLEHRHFGGIVPGITGEAVADVLDEVRDTLTHALSRELAPT